MSAYARYGLIAQGRGGAAFSPTDISGLALWLDASDATTLFQDSAGTTPATANNDVIGRWADKSGNSKHATQATTASKPLLKTETLNGRSTLYWAGTDDFLSTATLGPITQPNTVFVVAKGTGTGNQVIVDGDGDGTTRHQLLYRTTTGYLQQFAGNIINATTDLRGAFKVFSAVFNGASSSARVNGAAHLTGNPGAQAFGAVYIGRDGAAGGALLIGNIAEIIVYDALLDAGQIAQVESYLNAKWSVY